MVDVSSKQRTLRTAIATGHIALAPETVEAIQAGDVPKGDVLTCARLAGIQAAKRTADLIPLCHPLALSWAHVELTPRASQIEIRATVRANDATGVEMEALTAVTVAALTIYDMCKAVDGQMQIGEVRLVKKYKGAARPATEAAAPASARRPPADPQSETERADEVGPDLDLDPDGNWGLW